VATKADCSRQVSNDERYLPFEGSGAVSQWRLELPTDVPQFDHDTISDVVRRRGPRWVQVGRSRLAGQVRRFVAVGDLGAGQVGQDGSMSRQVSVA